MSATDREFAKKSPREAIDEIDEELVALLNRRARYVLAVGAIKHANGQMIFDPKRELDVYDHVQSVNDGPLTDDEIVNFFTDVMALFKRVQANPERVAEYQRRTTT